MNNLEKKWRVLGIVGALCVPAIVTAALSVPFSFKPGDPIKADQVNANFEALRASLDALNGGQHVQAVLGTLTLPGVVTAAPIRGFAQSLDIPIAQAGAGQGTGKPALSDVQVVRDAGEGTPPLDLLLNQQKHLATADIVIGNLSVHLSDVLVSRVTVSGVQAGRAQEAITLTFSAEQWTWQEGKAAAKVVSFDRTKAVADGTGALPASYAYFAPGVPATTDYVPITGYNHDMGCATPPCKVSHSSLSVQKLASAETLDALSVGLMSKRTQALDITWFTAAGSASHSVSLTDIAVSNVSLSSNADGTLTENDGFAYSSISWTAGKVQTGWDLTKGSAL